MDVVVVRRRRERDGVRRGTEGDARGRVFGACDDLHVDNTRFDGVGDGERPEALDMTEPHGFAEVL